ncbi:metalloregulator ArsR/SmtB family transcription factor [Ralstonia solanacearum species complex bacterium KE056]|uniref:ArsR/SmtB family transcription factor n=1 Tax=Ralstonia solanacearum species complex bacterium KE056 TaxID=3119585 RepID=UPI002FC2D4B0
MPSSPAELDGLAECASALAHPHRLQLTELLRAGPLNVEQLAKQANLTVANASRHLQILRRACLVDATRQGKQVFYELRDLDEYAALIAALRVVLDRQRATIRQLRADYLRKRELLAPVSRDELIALIRDEQVTIIDVRPEAEYGNSHIAGAINIPLGQLEARLSELPADREIVAYCRGPHCILSFEAVAALQGLGFKVRRLADGPVQWAAAGLTEAGA